MCVFLHSTPPEHLQCGEQLWTLSLRAYILVTEARTGLRSSETCLHGSLKGKWRMEEACQLHLGCPAYITPLTVHWPESVMWLQTNWKVGWETLGSSWDICWAQIFPHGIWILNQGQKVGGASSSWRRCLRTMWQGLRTMSAGSCAQSFQFRSFLTEFNSYCV